MNIDWIVAAVTFVVFVVFSFNYYAGMFVFDSDLEMTAAAMSERVYNSLMVDTYTMPLYYSSSGAQSDVPLYTDFSWPEGTKESTKVLLSGVEQLCYIDGDTIYWQSDLQDGKEDTFKTARISRIDSRHFRFSPVVRQLLFGPFRI